LLCRLYESQHAFRAALCDSFNTPAALGVLRDLITRTNVYITTRGKALNVQLLENTARWAGQMLRMFGLGAGPAEELGWGVDDASSGGVNVRFFFLFPGFRLHLKKKIDN
jgi:cysteinyl-tRNA synthetase